MKWSVERKLVGARRSARPLQPQMQGTGTIHAGAALPWLVGKAVSQIRTGPDLHVVLVAHEMAVVNALVALAGTHMRKDHRQAAGLRGIDEGCAGSVLGTAADCDGIRGAAVVVEGAGVNGAIGYFSDFRCHDSSINGDRKIVRAVVQRYCGLWPVTRVL